MTSVVLHVASASSTVDVETVAQAEIRVSVRRSMNFVGLEGRSIDAGLTVWAVGSGERVKMSTAAV